MLNNRCTPKLQYVLLYDFFLLPPEIITINDKNLDSSHLPHWKVTEPIFKQIQLKLQRLLQTNI